MIIVTNVFVFIAGLFLGVLMKSNSDQQIKIDTYEALLRTFDREED